MSHTVHIPFRAPIHVNGENPAEDLGTEIKRCAELYKQPVHRFSAKYELVPDPRGPEYGHYFIADVLFFGNEIELKKA